MLGGKTQGKTLASRMRAHWPISLHSTGFFRSVVTKKRRESAHARILEGILNGELRACVDSRRFFVTTDLKNPVQWNPSIKATIGE